MLRLASIRESAPVAPHAFGGPGEAERVSFGGVVFELLSAEPFALAPEDTRFACAGADTRTVADVACAVHVDSSREWPPPSYLGIQFKTEAGHTRVWADCLEVELSRLGPGRYAAAARIAPGPDAASALLRGIAAAVVQREGGLLLHAAAMELDGRAVLFVGPSGAGKSTALAMTAGARCFGNDHVALVRTSAGWFAWGLPGGGAAQAALAKGVLYPLTAVLRVRQGRAGAQPRAARASGVQALFLLRESVKCADLSSGAEDEYLRAVTALSSAVPVGEIQTVLGCDHAPVVRALLRASREPGST